MSHDESREERRAQKRREEVAKLRRLESEAVRLGTKVHKKDRLWAAFNLTRAWGEAKAAGLRKEDFQDEIQSRLQRPHGSRQEFRLSNWILKRGEDPTTQPGLVKEYETKTTPQKALEPYLVGISVAAEHCGADADDWKLAMARDLSIWPRLSGAADVVSPDERPSETLAVLLNALCVRLAKDNRLEQTFAAIRAMNCHWDMDEERLSHSRHAPMQRIESPIFPINEDCLHFGEMFPFPSIPLIRVPYVTGDAVFNLALANGHDPRAGTRMEAGEPRYEGIPGEVVWFREIRLCIVPGDRGGFVSALETRPHMEVRIQGETGVAGRYPVFRSALIDIADGSHYGPPDLGPSIQTRDGQTWAIEMALWPGKLRHALAGKIRPAFPFSSELYFDPDPIQTPGVAGFEPWYLSYTPATPPYLRHWLTQEWRRENEEAVCPWSRDNCERGAHGDRWDRNVPPIHELNFPGFSHATWIECCLHNGLIEEALQASIDRLKDQTTRLQADWHDARERHSNALLRRWSTETEQEGHQ
ncbi:hypothetical protein [Rhodovulum strictum]|uniref:Uncharacterized protein n=1 Tax=Rhodovulum strictum TaxID=58314 RepID=A0A844BRH3_9RHOB|nr:hypothetical protein [Rhodovulum strictum]MRH22537.1 hypothetical protein [Rhodovulum strictum]